MYIKKVFYISALLCLFAVPVTGWAAEKTYTVTEQELTELSTIFVKLDSKQKQQKALLDQQAEQLTTLQEQLEISKKRINSSQTEMRKLQTSLDTANQSLKESAEEAKRENDRLERQRDMWAAFAVIAVGAAIAHR